MTTDDFDSGNHRTTDVHTEDVLVRAHARLHRYGVSPHTGFLPEQEPLKRLPLGNYSAWEDFLTRLSGRLCAETNLRSAIKALPPLGDVSELQTSRELNRAFLVVSLIGQAYIWGEKPEVRVIPRNIARPWVEIARRLDVPPILNCDSIASQNWGLFDPTASIALGNVYSNNLFFGGVDESWFYLVTVDIEARGAQALEAICCAQEHVRLNDCRALTHDLLTIERAIVNMTASLNRMTERCAPWAFYNRVRRFLAGWTSKAFQGKGVIYEGEYNDEPQFFHGASAAQSSLIPSLDAAFEIDHKSSHSSAYLQEMRKYMKKNFREFIDSVAEGPSIQAYIKSRARNIKEEKDEDDDDTVLLAQAAFNACVGKLTEFRSLHIRIVCSYIVNQANASGRHVQGTGGTSIMPFLKASRDETAEGKF